jgi:hypothetical protein
MEYEHELFSALKPYANIIVYGAGARGAVLLERLKYSLKYSVYPVPAVFSAVSSAAGNPGYCSGYPVRVLDEYKELPAEETVVLISPQEKYHSVMEETARGMGFLNIVPISDALYRDIHHHYEQFNIIQRLRHSDFLQYQTMHNMRLDRLRAKIRAGGKARTVFLVTHESIFGSYDTVYKAMEKNPLFEPVLFVSEHHYFNDTPDRDLAENARKLAASLENKGYSVISAHGGGGQLYIEDLKADIVIFCYGGYHFHPHYDSNHDALINISNTLSCFIPYCLPVAKRSGDEYFYENEEAVMCWRYFIASRPDRSYAATKKVTQGLHHVVSGSPIYDAYAGESALVLPPKMQGRKIVVYAPHWSMGNNIHPSTSFHIYYKRVLALLGEYPDIGFVFRPHPSLGVEIGFNIGKPGIPAPDEWEEYCEAWENSPNGIIYTDGDYIDLFKVSDCLIGCSLSFLLSWLPTGKPCAVLRNPMEHMISFKDAFLARSVIESYYICSDTGELSTFMEEVIQKGSDPKAGERARQKEAAIHNLGRAGQFIADYIDSQLRG